MSLSQADRLAALPAHQRREILGDLTNSEAQALMFDWGFWARPEQLPPEGDWLSWVILAGRGFGKTRSGAEWVRAQVEAGRQRIALVAETHKDLVEVMCYGDSGLASVFPEHQRPKISTNPHVQVRFHTGAVGLGYNATQPDQLRGPQFDCAWCDELAKWKRGQETWDMLQFGLRLGDRPQALVTTTPRNVPVLKRILDDPMTRVTSGSTYQNRANLARSFLEQIRTRYEGTRLGRQELEAELLTDTPGALWTAAMFQPLPAPQDFTRVVVAIDPSGVGGEDEEGDEIGIIVAAQLRGRDDKGRNQYIVLEDASCRLSPLGWARRAVDRYNAHGASVIVAERNFGGAMVESNIRTVAKGVNVRMVTASRGKSVRAEPISALYEQGRVFHAKGADLRDLERQMLHMTATGYNGEGSPDRVDALVWALTELAVKAEPPQAAVGVYE